MLKTLYSDSSPFAKYPLVVCGHSLGGGCAAILALLLKPSFPSLKCFAYEPPGCLFDDKLAEMSEDFITSFVRNDDLVPRLSYHNLESVRDEMLQVFTQIKVPKIEVFFDLRAPCPDRFVAQRNAKLLMPNEDVSSETEFYKRLAKFRAERNEKNMAGVNRVQLYLPGKIIHLVDTKGDGKSSSYAAYWAHRKEFNQLILSSRMYADHDIHSLVDIINDTRLVGDLHSVSLAFHNAPLIFVDDDEVPDTDTRLFMCCSNHGKLPTVLSILGAVALSLFAYARATCEFLRAEVVLEGTPGVLTFMFGLDTYKLVQCKEDMCSSLSDLEQVGSCVPFPPMFGELGASMEAARVFALISTITGFVSVIWLWVTMCFVAKPRTWKGLSIGLLLTSFFQGLVLLIKKTAEICSRDDSDGLAGMCYLESGAILVIISSCLWFVVAIGTMHIARKECHMQSVE